MHGLGILAGLAALTAGAPHHMGRTRYPAGHKPGGYRFRPHNGNREVARRLRQRERDIRNQEARAITRLGTHAFVATYRDAHGFDADTIRVSRRGRIMGAV